ncbi:MAG: hypothetical protein JOY70_03240, partial [Acidisphaera sp.]|nr:hypothetical protein [Acidisphaera sp.]
HELSVSFLNDAWGGTAAPGNDCNLYLNGATVNGTTVSSGQVAMLWNGTVNMTFVTNASGTVVPGSVNYVHGNA